MVCTSRIWIWPLLTMQPECVTFILIKSHSFDSCEIYFWKSFQILHVSSLISLKVQIGCKLSVRYLSEINTFYCKSCMNLFHYAFIGNVKTVWFISIASVMALYRGTLNTFATSSVQSQTLLAQWQVFFVYPLPQYDNSIICNIPNLHIMKSLIKNYLINLSNLSQITDLKCLNVDCQTQLFAYVLNNIAITKCILCTFMNSTITIRNEILVFPYI